MKLFSYLRFAHVLLGSVLLTAPAVAADVDQIARQVEQAADKVEAALDKAATTLEAAGKAPAADNFAWGKKPTPNAAKIKVEGQSVTVEKDEIVPKVEVTHGSAVIDGEVTGDVVVIMGKAQINGKVWGSVVNVGEGIFLGKEAKIRKDAVGVLGGIRMEDNSLIDGQAVGIVGGIRMGDNSLIGGKAVGIVGGILKKAGAKIHGEEVSIPPWQGFMPAGIDMPQWASDSFFELVMKVRPLSLRIGWVWVVFAIFLGVYLLFGLVFPSACEQTANIYRSRPLTSFFVGLLLVPLIPLIGIILAGTVVGLVVVPFFMAAVFLGGLLGKAALLLYFGNSLGRAFKTQFPPLVAILGGSALLAVIYLVPFLGFIMLKVTDMWALGAATVALFAGFRKERPAAAATTSTSSAASMPVRPSTVPTAPALGIVPVAAGTAGLGGIAPPMEPVTAGVAIARETPPVTPLVVTPPEAMSLPRVGFKDRFFAGCLDWLLLMAALVPLGLVNYFLLISPVYFAVMWMWKQTSVGGILLRLKVVRLDGRRMDWVTAGVRALAAVFGFVAAGLGHFWAAWDPEKQGWHDKIAGTVVVKLNKVQPLV